MSLLGDRFARGLLSSPPDYAALLRQMGQSASHHAERNYAAELTRSAAPTPPMAPVGARPNEVPALDPVWGKGTPIPRLDPATWRLDDGGNFIRRFDYGDHQSPFGWEKDHIRAKALGGSDDLPNLRPLHHRTNASLGGLLGSALGKRS